MDTPRTVTPAVPEVLDRVRDIRLSPVDSGVRKRPVEQLAGGPDEWPTTPVLDVTRLFSDEDQARMRISLPEDGPGVGQVRQVTAPAGCGCRGQPGEVST